MPVLPRGNVTFLLTDIERSALLWERSSALMRKAVNRHVGLISDAVRRHGGQVIKERGEGDSVFAVFASAPKAVAAAVDAQRALTDEPWPLEVPLRVRFALHSGEIEPTDRDYVGQVPNRCARLRGICHGRQILISRTTHDLAVDRLPPEVTLRSLGSHRLRDLQHAEEVFQVYHPGLQWDFPALVSVDALPNNLPNQLTSFIGRDDEVRDLWRRTDRARLVTLVGEGGCGKTRLALHVGAELLPDFPRGVWFVDLSAVEDPVELPRAVAAVLGVREEGGQPLETTLIAAIADNRQLLILDNCERLLDATAHFVELALVSCPNLKVLATSREALRCRGEMVYRVPPLSLPDGTAVSPDRLAQHDATQLFLERAAFADALFAVNDQTAPIIVDVCRRLDGNALAIELAAANVGIQSLTDIQGRLFASLAGGPRTAPERQQSVAAAVAWSYDLLTDSHQRLFRRLSAFAGGWTLEAAVDVAGGGVIASSAVPNLLRDLVAKSLVVRQELADGSDRFAMHAVLRAFGRVKLAASDEANQVEHCHARYFMQLVEAAEPELKGAHQAEWLTRLDREADNVRAALRCMREHALVEECLRTAGALWRYWYIRGRFGEGREQLERALALAGPNPASPEAAAALHGCGTLAIPQGDFVAAQQHLMAALATWRETDNQMGEKNTLNNLGMIAYESGQYDDAQAYYEQSLALNRAMGDVWGVATAQSNIAGTAMLRGDLDIAEPMARDCLAKYRELGDRGAQSRSLLRLGSIAQDRGDLDVAQGLFEESHAIATELGSQQLTAEILRYQGTVAHELGEFDRAGTLYEASRQLAEEMGSHNYLALAQERLATLALDDDRAHDARALCILARDALGESGHLPTLADILENQGRTEAGLGGFREAGHLLAQSLQIRYRIGNPKYISQSLEGLAGLAHGLARHDRALTLMAAAERMRQEAGMPMAPISETAWRLVVEAARAALSANQADRAWRRGEQLTLDAAVRLALDDESQDSPDTC